MVPIEVTPYVVKQIHMHFMETVFVLLFRPYHPQKISALMLGVVPVLENSPVKGLPGVKERPGDNDFDLLRNEGT